MFLNGKDITDKNRANIENCVKKINDHKLRKDLLTKIKCQKGKASIDHHRKQVE